MLSNFQRIDALIVSIGINIRYLSATTNLKHKAIVVTIYSCGLRLSELINLKITDIQSDRHLLLIRDAKGNKDRNTILSDTTIALLRKYYLSYRPKEYLFEGQYGGQYSSKSVQSIVKHSLRLANIKKPASTHTLRHSFATHLLGKWDGFKVYSNTFRVIAPRKPLRFTLMYLPRVYGTL